jgi:hypothetical protein
VIAVRLEPPLHQDIVADAKASERTIAAEMEGLLRQALDYRRKFPTADAARAIEAATLGYLLAGERYARDHGINEPWTANLECRQAAVVAACVSLITNFVSSDPQQQALTVESIKGRVWTSIVNQPRSGQGETS